MRILSLTKHRHIGANAAQPTFCQNVHSAVNVVGLLYLSEKITLLAATPES